MPTIATPLEERFGSRRAYTLVEVLMVITIVGILAALLVVAAGRAVTFARQVRVTTEINMLDLALESYKLDKAAGFPPDFGTLANNQSGWSQRQARIM
ncbi:MAG TPA: type II secretion system protein, partial [Pirellulales bacterium]|nr:type II secretion system protein [Pirellulales bacterium]